MARLSSIGVWFGMLLCWQLHPLAAQTTPGVQLGGGFSYDYGVSADPGGRFQPYGKGQIGTFGFDGFIGIPVRPFCIYPSFGWATASRLQLLEDSQGDYLPLGYAFTRPTASDAPYFIYGPEYSDLSALSDLTETRAGAYLLLHIGAGVELGSGIFVRNARMEVYSNSYRDVYIRAETNGGTDTYTLYDTESLGQEMYSFSRKRISIPIVLQWRYASPFMLYGTSFTCWLGGGDPYISFRTSFALNFARE